MLVSGPEAIGILVYALLHSPMHYVMSKKKKKLAELLCLEDVAITHNMFRPSLVPAA